MDTTPTGFPNQRAARLMIARTLRDWLNLLPKALLGFRPYLSSRIHTRSARLPDESWALRRQRTLTPTQLRTRSGILPVHLKRIETWEANVAPWLPAGCRPAVSHQSHRMSHFPCGTGYSHPPANNLVESRILLSHEIKPRRFREGPPCQLRSTRSWRLNPIHWLSHLQPTASNLRVLRSGPRPCGDTERYARRKMRTEFARVHSPRD